MSDLSDQQADLFVVEPVTQLDGSPAPQPGRLSEATWRERLGPPGMAALAEGLALLLCFFAPWFYFPDFQRVSIDVARPTLINYSGLSAALGINWWPAASRLFCAALADSGDGGGAAGPYLGVCSAPLLRSAGAGGVVALSVLALLVEFGFYAQVQLLRP